MSLSIFFTINRSKCNRERGHRQGVDISYVDRPDDDPVKNTFFDVEVDQCDQNGRFIGLWATF